MKRISIVSLLLVAGTAGTLAPSAASEPPPLSLREAIEIAEAHNPRLAAAEAREEVGQLQIVEARSALAPSVAVSEVFSRTTHPALVFSDLLRQENFQQSNFDLAALNSPDALNNFSTRVEIAQPLWTGGRARSEVKAARLRKDVASSRLESTRQQVVLDIIDAYTGAVLAEGRLALARESLKTARANTDLVRDLEAAGLVVGSDRMRAEVRETEVQEMLIRAESAVSVSRARINLVLGRDLGTPFVVPRELDPLEEKPHETLEELITSAWTSRPDLRSADLALEAKDHDVRGARAARRPQIGLNGSYELNGNTFPEADGSNWSVFVGARFTVFDGGAAKSRVGQAEGLRRVVNSEREILRHRIDLEVRESFHHRLASRKRLEQTSRAVELARESLRMVQDRYREGLTTLIDLLDNETALTEARTRELAARRDLLLAQAALDLSVGRL